MEKLRKSMTAKIIAIILFVLSFWAAAGSCVAITILYKEGIYTNINETFTENLYDAILWQYNEEFSAVLADWINAIENSTGEEAYYYEQIVKGYEKQYDADNTNYYCIVKDLSGKEIFKTAADIENYSYVNNDFCEYIRVGEGYELFIFEAYVREPKLANDELLLVEKIGNFVDNNKYGLIFVLAGSVLLDILILVFLMWSAGCRKKEGEKSFYDKIPFDLFLAVLFVIIGLGYSIHYDYIYRNVFPYDIFYMVSSVTMAVLMILWVLMTFAAHLRRGTLFSGMLVVKAAKIAISCLRYVAGLSVMALKNIDVIWKAGIVYAAMTLFEMIMIFQSYAAYRLFGFVLLWMFAKIVIAGVLILVLINFKQVRLAAEKLADGDINYKADTKYMQWDIKKHAKTLNSIGGGLSKAVDEKMKSERLKTELITNVSHDIKTPLTSIINYVDLLKKEELENEKAQEYLEVLDRQSHRLKKLTEDLVEASKASTGNISVNKQKTDLGMILSQALGEYEERINTAGLITVLRIPENPITIMTDGRLLWRVFDNLFSNICKYSMSDTRVYIELQALSNEVFFIFRNISRYELNISSDELMERFVRGDSSRNTEGSGLGLSIAKSLVDLLGGTFSLNVDGDLFKVILSFSMENDDNN